MSKKLTFIAENENIEITTESIKEIALISNGDMRRGIMLLQNLKYLNKAIKITDIYEVANMVLNSSLNKIIDICIIDRTSDIKSVVKLANDFRKSGYPINSVLKQLNLAIVASDVLSNKMKSLIALHLSNTEKRLLNGADEYLQLLNVFTLIKSIALDIDTVYNNV